MCPIYPKHSYTSVFLNLNKRNLLSNVVSKTARAVANNVDPDEMPHSAVSHLGLHCLLRPVCPNTYGKVYPLV